MRLDAKVAGWAVVALTVLSAFVLGVLFLTPEAERGDLIRIAAGPLGGLVAAVGGLIAAWASRAGAKETAAQTPMIEQIKHQTNGSLDARFVASENRIIEQVSQMLGASSAPAVEAGAYPLGDTPESSDGGAPFNPAYLIGRPQ